MQTSRDRIRDDHKKTKSVSARIAARIKDWNFKRKRKTWKQLDHIGLLRLWIIIAVVGTLLLGASLGLIPVGCANSETTSGQAMKIAGYCCLIATPLLPILTGIILKIISSHNKKAKRLKEKDKYREEEE